MVAAVTNADVRASKVEFEKRFWIICAIYFAGSCLSVFDHTPFIAALRHLIAPSVASGSAEAERFARIVILFGSLLVFLAAALRTWGAAYLRTEIVHDTSQHSEALVADGPFRYTRNPLYLANLPMAAGIGVLASRSGFIFLVLANWIFVYRLISREEESMLKTQGESYRAYCQAVPRFWPALRPRVPAGNGRPHWPEAFVGETFIWIFAVGELLAAIMLRPLIAWIAFAVGFVANFLINRRIQRQRSNVRDAAKA
jgi:protein-S-isoprenylcysteine O-methyltransferase Ste14